MSGKWESLESLLVGVPVDVHASWQAGVEIADPQAIRFRLRALGEDEETVWEQAADPLAPLPATWPRGQVYRLTHRLNPQMSTSGTVTVRLELCALQGEETLACAIIGRPQVTNRPPLLALARPPEHISEATWDGQLRLAGYDLAREGDALALTLYWQVVAPPAMALKRFVHAVDGGGQILAQADDVPDNGGIPMRYWRPGEYVVDRVELKVPAEKLIAALYAGFYEPGTGRRIPVRSDAGTPLPDQRLSIPGPY